MERLAMEKCVFGGYSKRQSDFNQLADYFEKCERDLLKGFLPIFYTIDPMANTSSADFQKRMQGFSLTTAQIIYRLPDYPS